MRGPFFPVHFRLETPSCNIAASMDPQGYRKFGFSLSSRRSPDIEVQAVLTELRITVEEEFGSVATGRV